MVRAVCELGKTVIRSWKSDDIDGYARIVGDPLAMKYISNGKTRDLEAARAEIDRFSAEIDRQGWSRWAISEGLHGAFVGYVGFALKADGIDFGGRSLPDYWGSPHTSIACLLALDHGLASIGFDVIYGCNHVDNFRAWRMAERSGMTLVGLVDMPTGPHRRFELSRHDYLHRGIREKNMALAEKLALRGSTMTPRMPERALHLA